MNGDQPGGQVDVGSVVAGYRLVGVLGVGGSGTVYRAERNGVVVALKLLNAEHAHNEGERERFAREAEVVRRLAHPHVVGLLDYGFAGHLPYLVFPFLEGRTLEKRIQSEGKVGWSLTGRFSEQVLSALEVAHGMGIAHRDIKPANIFCTKSDDGESIRILDFGTAKIVRKQDAAEGATVTRAGMLIGTPRYMAPEQARGEEITPAADVYAFGLVMAEMLIGKPLVTGVADLDIYVMQGSDKPHELPEEIRISPFATIIERAIAKPLDVRYRLASQMLADVRAVLARFGQGASVQSEADLEATQFIGIAPLAAAVPESAVKLRKVFNAMAEKAAAASAPTSSPKPPPTQADQPAPAAVRATTPGLQAPRQAPAIRQTMLGLDAPDQQSMQQQAPSQQPSVHTAPTTQVPVVQAPAQQPIVQQPIAQQPPAHQAALPQPPPRQQSAPSFSNLDVAARQPSAPHFANPQAAMQPNAPVAPLADLLEPRSPASAAPPALPALVARKSSGPGFTIAVVLLLLAAAGLGVAYLVKKRNAPRLADASTTALAVEASATAAGTTSPTASAAAEPPATAPPGAFTTNAIDHGALAKFLGDKDAKQTPELYELALDGMAACDLEPGVKPTCQPYKDYEATVKRPMEKSGYPKRLAVAVKHLKHAVPSVRLLAARMMASAHETSDLDALLEAAKVEPVPMVLAEMLTAMGRDRQDFIDFDTTALANASPLVRGAACSALGTQPAQAPLEPIEKLAKSDADATVRTRCFGALTSLWVRTSSDPRKEAYDAMLSILEAKPRDAAHLPDGLGRLAEAKLAVGDDDHVGIKWAKKVKAFYDQKHVLEDVEDVALDAAAPLALRGACLKTLASLDGDDRASSVKKKIAKMGDADSQTLTGKPKKTDSK